MKVFDVSAGEYGNLFPHRTHIFNSEAFIELNRHKCVQIYRLVFCDGRAYAGLVLGERDGMLMSPFSAPFGGFDINREPSASRMTEIAEWLKEWLAGRRCTIVLPPPFYGSALTTKSAYAMQIIGAQQDSLINHHLAVTSADIYASSLDSKSRNKLKRGLSASHTFIKLDSRNPQEIERAYRIIAVNRANKGYPLWMSLNEVISTTATVHAEFFLLNINGEDVASAMVYPVAPGIVQVIYWGDTGVASDSHPMNLLAYCLNEHYSHTDTEIIDIGPSGDFKTLNSGLADFKESVGCSPTLKLRYTLNP
ncbi:MAG: hypothetical protein NC127_05560 [Muribaculum sp.]|nr:hypothetical protein [Muribaculum sp.]